MSLRHDLTAYVRRHILRDPAARLGPEDSLIEAGVLDSIGLMNLIAHIESTTGVRIPDSEVTPENFDRASTIEELVNRLRRGREPPVRPSG